MVGHLKMISSISKDPSKSSLTKLHLIVRVLCLLFSQHVTTLRRFNWDFLEQVLDLSFHSKCGSWTTQLDLPRNKRAIKTKLSTRNMYDCETTKFPHSHHSHHSSDPISKQGPSTFPLLAGNLPFLGVTLWRSFWSHRSDISLMTTWCRIRPTNGNKNHVTDEDSTKQGPITPKNRNQHKFHYYQLNLLQLMW